MPLHHIYGPFFIVCRRAGQSRSLPKERWGDGTIREDVSRPGAPDRNTIVTNGALGGMKYQRIFHEYSCTAVHVEVM